MGNSNFKQHYDTASKTGVLQLTGCRFKEIPHEVLNLRDVLRNLDLSKNRLNILPDEISTLKQLKLLYLESNRLERIPSSIGELKKLELLNLSTNLLYCLPDSVSNLQNLKQVYLNNNKLKEFPKQLLSLKNLEFLELSKNNITEIPYGMSELYAEELSLSLNQISTLGDLYEAPRLKILRIEENCLSIEAIPPRLMRHSKIHTISLDGNLFESKDVASIEGYEEYAERYTELKKKMF